MAQYDEETEPDDYDDQEDEHERWRSHEQHDGNWCVRTAACVRAYAFCLVPDCCCRTAIRGCGVCLCLVLGFCAIAWIVAALPLMDVSDAPAFARTFLYASTAHHTLEWAEWKREHGASPPPPAFH